MRTEDRAPLLGPMAGFLLRRLLWTLPVLFGVSVVVFAMLHLAPGDPAKAMLGPRATPEALERIRESLGLNEPLIVQYFTWVANVLHGDLGMSIRRGVPVASELMTRLSNSLILAAAAFVFATVCGMALGIAAALRRGRLVDRAIMIVSTLGVSTPPFWLGILLIVALAVGLGWFPISGMYSITSTERSLPELLHHLVLPAITLGAAPLAVIARMTRSAMLEEIGKDYVAAARAKGVTESRIVFRHVLRNAFAPILTVLGLQVGFLLASSVLVEIVFSWPGIGTLMVDSILTRDFPVTQGSVLVIALVYVVSNTIVDVLYAVNDPRIRL